MKRPLLLLLTLASTLAYLGLAVLGWGGFAAFFAHPSLIAIVVLTILMGVAGVLSHANLSAGTQEDRGNRWVLAAFGVIGVLAGWLPAYTDRLNVWTLDGTTLRWAGVVLYAAGGALRLWPVFVLGHRFSGLVAIQRGHALVTDGPYRLIRHPSYLGLLVLSLGWALAFRSGAGLLLVAITLVPLIARIRAEEALLHRHFGAAYDAYRSQTWRLAPGLY